MVAWRSLPQHPQASTRPCQPQESFLNSLTPRRLSTKSREGQEDGGWGWGMESGGGLGSWMGNGGRGWGWGWGGGVGG